jgi:hypothetical protein
MKKLLLTGVAELFLATGAFMALRPAQAADIPQQYRGHWCETKWQTIFRRCAKSGDEMTPSMVVGRNGYGVEDEGCTVQTVRKDKRYGGHRISMMCEHVDSGPHQNAAGNAGG